jgi:hypothetical protein
LRSTPNRSHAESVTFAALAAKWVPFAGTEWENRLTGDLAIARFSHEVVRDENKKMITYQQFEKGNRAVESFRARHGRNETRADKQLRKIAPFAAGCVVLIVLILLVRWQIT